MNNPMENFRKNLKEKVEDNKMTQRELARLLNCNQSSISLWINGKAEPKISVVLKCSKFLIQTFMICLSECKL